MILSADYGFEVQGLLTLRYWSPDSFASAYEFVTQNHLTFDYKGITSKNTRPRNDEGTAYWQPVVVKHLSAKAE